MQLPRRLARRLLDLQFLPYIVVTNPHIKRVYLAYYHAFTTLIKHPPVRTHQDNVVFSQLLKELVEGHGVLPAFLAALSSTACTRILLHNLRRRI